MQYLFVPVDKRVAAYEMRTWNVAFELTDSSISEVRICDHFKLTAKHRTIKSKFSGSFTVKLSHNGHCLLFWP